MLYTFACEKCGNQFDQRVRCGTRTVPCVTAGCDGTAGKQFDPKAASILIDRAFFHTTPEDWRLPADPTRNKTANYLEGELLDRHCNEMYAAVGRNRKNQTDFAADFLKSNPDIDPNERLTRDESRELKAALGVGS